MPEEEEILKHLKEGADISEIPEGGICEIWYKDKLVARRVGAEPIEK